MLRWPSSYALELPGLKRVLTVCENGCLCCPGAVAVEFVYQADVSRTYLFDADATLVRTAGNKSRGEDRVVFILVVGRLRQ
jgi:hypothetical protein